ncbi:MAG: hypothetical protein ACP5H8_02745 [Candidatus Micrarchaeia archaeon]
MITSKDKDIKKQQEIDKIKQRILADNVPERRIDEVKAKYDVRSVQEITPSFLVMVANTLATQEFKDEQTNGDDYKRYKQEVDKVFEYRHEDEEGVLNKLMVATISIANEILVILNNYKKDVDNIINRMNERAENIWNQLPDISKTWKNVSLKLSAIGISGSFWGAVYSRLKEVFEPTTSVIATTIMAAGVFMFVDKIFLRMFGEVMKIIDRGITGIKLYIVEKRYIRLKKRELEALAEISKEQLEIVGVACNEVDKKLIKKLCGTLPKV